MEKEYTKWQANKTEFAHSSYYDGSAFGLLLETAKKFPNNIAIDFYDKKTTYKSLCKKIICFAEALTKQLIVGGDIVTIITPNMPQAIIAFYAINKIGAVANILHPETSKKEIESIVKKTKSKAIIVLGSLFEKVKDISLGGDAPGIIVTSIYDELPVFKKCFAKKTEKISNMINMRDMVAGDNSFENCEDNGDSEAVAVIMYSGGTTGTPKGVMLSNKNLNCLPVYICDVYGTKDIWGVKSLALMPIFHGFGLTVCVHGMLCNASRIFLVSKFDAKYLSKLIYKKKINLLYGVPAFYEAFSRSIEIDKKKCDFLQNVVSGGDKISEKLMKKLNSKFERGGSNARVREAYGLTECSAGVSINPYFAMKQNSVGLPFANIKIKIVDINSQDEIKAGEIGEVCISGPNVMVGYFEDEEETKLVLKKHSDGELWLHTNDLGYVDEDGYLFIVDRISKFFISGGYNVFPSQIEKAVMLSGIVQECCVVSVDDRALGKRGKLFVVPSTEQSSKEIIREVLKTLKENIPEYSIPKDIEIVDSLPKTKMQKIDYEKLKEQSK